MKITKRFLILLLIAAIPQIASAQAYAIRDVRIVTGSGEIIPNGNILIQDGRIAAIGEDISIPRGTETIDGEGLSAYPGMIDPHTSVGLREIGSVAATVDSNEMGDLNPHMMASGAISPTANTSPSQGSTGSRPCCRPRAEACSPVRVQSST